VEEVPVLGVADCCLAVLLDLVEVLDLEPAQQLLGILACLAGHVGLGGPTIAVAEELSAEATAGPQRGDDPLPNRPELVRWTEGERVARVDEVGLGPLRVFEPRDLCFEAGCAAGAQIAAPQQPLNCLRLGVDREHSPAAPEQLGAVSPRAAAEIDGEQSSCGGARFCVEALEREQERFPRLFAGRVVVARPGGTHRRRQTNADARARRLGVRPRVRRRYRADNFHGLAPSQVRPAKSGSNIASRVARTGGNFVPILYPSELAPHHLR
jgi:hypothetical protein